MPESGSADRTRRDIFKVASGALLMGPLGACTAGHSPPARDRAPALAYASEMVRGFKTSGFAPKAVPVPLRPYRVGASRKDNGAHDAAGVRIMKLDGRRWDHPVLQAAYGLQNMWSWETTHDPYYLARARAQADRLVARRAEARGAWFFPYPFAFPAPDHHMVMKPPWYSAMAQGEALSLFSRLADTAALPPRARNGYRRAADRVFAALCLGPRRRPWVTRLDGHGYLCFEEYPQSPARRSDFTFNGHNYVAFGLWDYHAVTGSQHAAQLFDGALTATVRYARILRRPGDYSSYCLRHDIRSGKYHHVVIRQLRVLYDISGNSVFAGIATKYTRDAAKAGR